MPDYREGPPRYFRPVCVRTPQGFVGGPSGYHEVSEKEAKGAGPIVIDTRMLVDGAPFTDAPN